MRTTAGRVKVSCPSPTVPGQIVIALFAELKVSGFWLRERRFAELLRNVDEDDATDLGGRPGEGRVAAWVELIGAA